MNQLEPTIAISTHYGTGGSLLYLQRLAGALHKRDYPVIFYLPHNTDIGMSNTSSCRFSLKEPSTSPPFIRTKFLKYPYHLSKYIYNALIIRPERYIKGVHLLFPFYLTDWITIGRLKRRGIKVVLTVHEVFPHKPFLGTNIDMKLLRRMYEYADLLLVHTNSLKKKLFDLFSINPENIHVVPHGVFKLLQSPVDVMTLKKKYHVPINKKVLLFFGTIRGNKGLDILLHAMQELKTDFFLLISGDIAGKSETPTKYYEEIIEKSNIGDSVYWVKKYMSNEEASEVFKIADTVILPYKKSYYAQSGVLNLSIGYEKPLVVTNVGGIGEAVTNYNLGTVVEPENTDAMRNGIIKLFENHSDVYGFKRYKEENSWDRVAEKYIKIYEGLLCSKRF
jgi:glycosyltransferase involved in cell wall biosynthesis